MPAMTVFKPHPIAHARLSDRAIVLKRKPYGDWDLIVTLLTRLSGKRVLMARAARRSRDRFGCGVLEPFTHVEIAYSPASGRMASLEDASHIHSFETIRSDPRRTACGCYWMDLLNLWLEEASVNEARHLDPFFDLLLMHLTRLDALDADADHISLSFQVQFLSISGLMPNLTHCCECRKDIEQIPFDETAFDLRRGGPLCSACALGIRHVTRISKACLKQLFWLTAAPSPRTAERLRLTPGARAECLSIMESFVPFHIGRHPKSLRVLQQMRK